MKKILAFSFVVLFCAINAQAAKLVKTVVAAKEVVLNLEEEPAGEDLQPQTIKVRLKQIITVRDCNERSFDGAFFKVENHPYLTVAKFYLMATEMYCPLEKPVTKTVYSKEITLTISPYVAGGIRVLIPADADLEILPNN